ncbi:hypothetical protein LJC74_09450 [Eubacteriales bacterium OttesenSCG-928-A19]|nr:hypothetical protein [Eubacteriales bacterium OttesenSCG-928-A19]
MKIAMFFARLFGKRKKTTQPKVANPDVGLYWTVEGCVISKMRKETIQDVSTAFSSLPASIKHRMAFSPKAGEWLPRAHWWRSFLYQVLEPSEAARAMQRIARWYRCCIRDLPRDG